MDCGTTGFLLLYYLPEFSQNHVHWVNDATRPSHSLSPPSLPASIFSSIRVFSNELALCIRRPEDWSFSFSISISPSNDYLWLIFFRIDWYDLLAIQGNLKRILQHHTSKASILWCSASFMVQLSHPYMTPGKIITLIIQTFVSKLMSLLFNTLSRFVIAFIPRSKCLLISWLQHHPQWFWSPRI